MSLDLFLADLFDNGRVRVAPPAEFAPAELAAATVRLAEFEQLVRDDFPGTPPEFIAPVALWAAQLFYRACQFAVYRDFGAAEVQQALAIESPAGSGAEAAYAVDLTFQYLPDLHRLTRQAAPADPLVQQIEQWAAAWPLSSVGMTQTKVSISALDAVLGHRGLCQCYVDRILARGARERMSDPRVAAAVAASIGLHTSLAGELAVPTARTTLSGISQ